MTDTLYVSKTSPYVRKVVAAAIEKSVEDKITKIEINTSPVNSDKDVMAVNPLGKIPCLVTQDKQIIFDSRVIVQYIDGLSNQNSLLPSYGSKDWFINATLESLSDGILDAAVLVRYEGFLRPEEKRWDHWYDGQMLKVHNGLDALEMRAIDWFKQRPLSSAALSASAALGYLDFRYADLGWQKDHPKLAAWYHEFSKRSSMIATIPH